MEIKEFKTSSGYTAKIKASLDFGDYRKIKTAVKKQFRFSISSETKLDSVNNKDIKFSEMDLNSLTVANDLAISLLLVSIIDPKGNDLGSPIEALDTLPPKDGLEIVDEIDRITKSSEIDQKKGA